MLERTITRLHCKYSIVSISKSLKRFMRYQLRKSVLEKVFNSRIISNKQVSKSQMLLQYWFTTARKTFLWTIKQAQHYRYRWQDTRQWFPYFAVTASAHGKQKRDCASVLNGPAPHQSIVHPADTPRRCLRHPLEARLSTGPVCLNTVLVFRCLIVPVAAHQYA